jgi:hypothetical protein
MLLSVKHSATSVILRVKLLDSTVSTGAGKTGLTYSSSGLKISTIVDNEAAATTYTSAGSTTEDITTLGTYAAPTATKCRFKAVDGTNHPGVYEIHLANARFSVASARSLLVSISGVTGLAECDFVVQLNAADDYPVNVATWLGSAPNTLQSGRVDGYLGATATDVITSTSLASTAVNEVRDALLTYAVESQGSITLQQAMSIMLSALAGVTSNSGNTLKTPNGSATRIAATTNASGERTAMTLTPSS